MILKSTLNSSPEIKKALGTTYEYLKEFDQLPKERLETTKLKKELWMINPNRICAACGVPESKNIRLEAAHVEALEECGTTWIENLLPLCRRYGVKGREQGCHTLFDDGHISVNRIKELRKNWMTNNLDIIRDNLEKSWEQNDQQTMNMGTGSTDEIQSVVNRGHYRKAIGIIKRKISQKNLKEHDKIRYKIKILELNRRRTAKKALEDAEKMYDELMKSNIPSDLKSWFYYESGYLFKIKGDHKQARKNFVKSFETSTFKKNDDHAKQAAALSLILQSAIPELLWQKNTEKISNKKYHMRLNELEKELDNVEKIASKAHNMHGMRWVSTCKWHKALFQVVKGDIKQAYINLLHSQEDWHERTVGTGLTLASRPHINAIAGIVYGHKGNKEDARNAMVFLSRAMIGLLGKNRLRPEGIRDIFFTMSKCLELLGDKHKKNHVIKLSEVTNSIQDGSSWIYPA